MISGLAEKDGWERGELDQARRCNSKHAQNSRCRPALFTTVELKESPARILGLRDVAASSRVDWQGGFAIPALPVLVVGRDEEASYGDRSLESPPRNRLHASIAAPNSTDRTSRRERSDKGMGSERESACSHTGGDQLALFFRERSAVVQVRPSVNSPE